ncbi:MAG TPA: MipA/OmpV family protein [Burkholderiales bacterium]|nr:MipA/OmpV family protein [Burkholderiales bacterium]
MTDSLRVLVSVAMATAMFAAAPRAARPAELPLWEAGAGVAVLNFPDYRGSDQRQTLVLPIPYLVYRGDFLKADRESIRGQFYKDDRFDLHLSVNGSIPVDSSDNSARRGMPDLDPTLEIGPNLTVMLLRSDTVHLNLRFPVRAVIATDLSHVRDEGWIFQPQINVDFYDRFPGPGWNLGFAAGPLFGNKRYHNYFYGVAAQFATPERPAFEASAGYGGMQWIAALSKRYPSYWVGGFVRADTLSGAVFDSSPLVRKNESYAAGFAIAWILGKSQNRVEAQE